MKSPVITAAEASKWFRIFEKCDGYTALNVAVVHRVFKEHRTVVSEDYWADMVLTAAEAICGTSGVVANGED